MFYHRYFQYIFGQILPTIRLLLIQGSNTKNVFDLTRTIICDYANDDAQRFNFERINLLV